MSYAEGTTGCSCGRRWSSLRECHCPTCHLHFRNEESFDFHRTGEPEVRHCLSEHQMAKGDGRTKRKPMYKEVSKLGTVWSRREPRVYAGGAGVLGSLAGTA